jgi:hypothetical protein
MGKIYSDCLDPGIKILSGDKTLGVNGISTEIPDNLIYSPIMLGLFLTEGMDGTVQNFNSFTYKVPKASQCRISGEIKITPIVIQYGLETGLQ